MSRAVQAAVFLAIGLGHAVTDGLISIYDPPASDRYRILVDGLWPRGISRERAAIDEWLRDIAPSAQLRTWYQHDAERFVEFTRRYRKELREFPRADALTALAERVRRRPVALITATRDVEHSHAAVLLDLLRGQ